MNSRILPQTETEKESVQGPFMSLALKIYVTYVKSLTFAVSSSNIVKFLETEKSSKNASKISLSKKVNKIKNNLAISCSCEKR